MAIATKNSRLNKVNQEYDRLSVSWNNVADAMSRELPHLKNFAAWRNEMFLTNSGDIDEDDMVQYRTQFDAIFAKLAPVFMVLSELNDMTGVSAEQFKSDNDAFISKYSIDIIEYDKKFV